MRSRVHPSKRKLSAWLETGGPESIDVHVTTCDRCATLLEEIATPSPNLGQALAATLRPPDDLVVRLNGRIAESLSTRADLRLFAELMGISVPTARMLLGSDPTEER